MKLPFDGESLTQALESATARLVEVDPVESASVERILTERALAVQQLAGWLETQHGQCHPDLAARLQRIFDAGACATLRLAIARQDVVAELSHLHSELALLRALAAPQDPAPSALDCEG